jgi:hypothetical protein
MTAETGDLLAMLDRIGDDLVENADAISDIAARAVEDNLLDIPAFLVRGTPENDAALAAGAIALAARPRASVARVKIAPVAPSKTERKRTKRDADAEVRRALLKADFSPGFVARCPIAKARRILSDLAAGLGAPREDQI